MVVVNEWNKLQENEWIHIPVYVHMCISTTHVKNA